MNSATERANWSDLRRTRHRPPGAARAGVRQKTYVSALQQAEELFRAASVVGTATRPLLQFYGLSQAGRAIGAAAVAAGPNDWRLSGHGVKNADITGPLSDVKIYPDGRLLTSFVGLSTILGSPLWNKTDAPTLARVWDSLVEAIDLPLVDNPDRRPVLCAFPDGQEMEQHPLVAAKVAGLPVILALQGATLAQFDEFMASYPTAVGYRPVVTQLGTPQCEAWNFDTVSVDMTWETGHKWPAPETVRYALKKRIMRKVGGDHYIFPETVAGKDPLHPLMAWWCVLYTLSMLARYQPAEWASITDIDSSPYANKVEVLLDVAQTTVPALIRETLREVSS